MWKKFIHFVGNMIQKGNRNYLVVSRKNERIKRLSLTLTTLITVIMPPLTIGALIFILLTGHNIRFQGKQVEKTVLNDVMTEVENKIDEFRFGVAKKHLTLLFIFGFDIISLINNKGWYINGIR